MVRALMLSGLKTVVLWKRQEVELEVAKVKMFSLSNQDGLDQGWVTSEGQSKHVRCFEDRASEIRLR